MRPAIQKPITVALLSGWFPPQLGGIPTVLSTLVRQYESMGVGVVVITPSQDTQTHSLRNVVMLRSKVFLHARNIAKRFFSIKDYALEQALKELRECADSLVKDVAHLGPSIIHSHTDVFFAEMVSRSLGVPIVHTIHHCFEEFNKGDKLDEVIHFIERLKLQAATAVSNFVKTEWESRIRSCEIQVVLNPLRTDLFTSQPDTARNALRSSLGLAPETKLICYPQRLQKPGVADLLRAFDKVLEWNPECRLLLCSSDRVSPELDILLSSLRARRSILTQSFPLDQMPAVYSASDVVILPNPVEPFGMPAWEALATGVPVLACNGGAYAELLVDEETTLFHFLGDTDQLAQNVLKVLGNPDWGHHLVAMARRDLPRFQPESIAHQYAEIYHDAMTL